MDHKQMMADAKRQISDGMYARLRADALSGMGGSLSRDDIVTELRNALEWVDSGIAEMTRKRAQLESLIAEVEAMEAPAEAATQ